MNFFAIFAQCLDRDDSATIQVAESVLHRFSIFLVSEVLPHSGLSMLVICIDLDFK